MDYYSLQIADNAFSWPPWVTILRQITGVPYAWNKRVPCPLSWSLPLFLSTEAIYYYRHIEKCSYTLSRKYQCKNGTWESCLLQHFYVLFMQDLLGLWTFLEQLFCKAPYLWINRDVGAIFNAHLPEIKKRQIMIRLWNKWLCLTWYVSALL